MHLESPKETQYELQEWNLVHLCKIIRKEGHKSLLGPLSTLYFYRMFYTLGYTFQGNSLKLVQESLRELVLKLHRKLSFRQRAWPWRYGEFQCFTMKQEIAITQINLVHSLPKFTGMMRDWHTPSMWYLLSSSIALISSCCKKAPKFFLKKCFFILFMYFRQDWSLSFKLKKKNCHKIYRHLVQCLWKLDIYLVSPRVLTVKALPTFLTH